MSTLGFLASFIPGVGPVIGKAIDMVGEDDEKNRTKSARKRNTEKAKVTSHLARSLAKDLALAPLRLSQKKAKDIAQGIIMETPLYNAYAKAAGLSKKAGKYLDSKRKEIEREGKILQANNVRDAKITKAIQRKREKEQKALEKQISKDIKEEQRYQRTIKTLNDKDLKKKGAKNSRIDKYSGIVTGNPNRNVIRQNVTATSRPEGYVYDRKKNRVNIDESNLRDSFDAQERGYVYDRRKNRVSLPGDKPQSEKVTQISDNLDKRLDRASEAELRKTKKREYARNYYQANKNRLQEQRRNRAIAMALELGQTAQDSVNVINNKVEVISRNERARSDSFQKLANDVNAVMEYITSNDNAELAALQRQVDNNSKAISGLSKDVNYMMDYLTQNQEVMDVQNEAQAKLAELKQDQSRTDYIAQLEQAEADKEAANPENDEAKLTAVLESLSKKGELKRFFVGNEDEDDEDEGDRGIISKMLPLLLAAGGASALGLIASSSAKADTFDPNNPTNIINAQNNVATKVGADPNQVFGMDVSKSPLFKDVNQQDNDKDQKDLNLLNKQHSDAQKQLDAMTPTGSKTPTIYDSMSDEDKAVVDDIKRRMADIEKKKNAIQKTLDARKAPAAKRVSTDNQSNGQANTNFDLDSYRDAIGKAESGGDYTKVNQYNYVGRYQMGYAALVDAGYVKDLGPSGNKKNSNLDNPDNWLGGYDKNQFLQDPDAQDDAFNKYTGKNLNALKRQGTVSDDSSPQEVAGYLGAAHLIGPRGVSKEGLEGTDANGTTAAKWYAKGANSQYAKADDMQPVQAGPTASDVSMEQAKNDQIEAKVSEQAALPTRVIQQNTPKTKQQNTESTDSFAAITRNPESMFVNTNKQMDRRGVS